MLKINRFKHLFSKKPRYNSCMDVRLYVQVNYNHMMWKVNQKNDVPTQ